MASKFTSNREKILVIEERTEELLSKCAAALHDEIFGRLLAAKDIDVEFEKIAQFLQENFAALFAEKYDINSKSDSKNVLVPEVVDLSTAETSTEPLGVRNAQSSMNGSSATDVEMKSLLRKKQLSYDIPEKVTVSLIDEWNENTPHEEEAILKKTGMVMAAFPHANFDVIFYRLSNANDINAEYIRIMDELEMTAEGTEYLATTIEKSTLSQICKIFPDVEPTQVAQLIAKSKQKDITHIVEAILRNGTHTADSLILIDDEDDDDDDVVDAHRTVEPTIKMEPSLLLTDYNDDQQEPGMVQHESFPNATLASRDKTSPRALRAVSRNLESRITAAKLKIKNSPQFGVEVRTAVTELRALINEQEQIEQQLSQIKVQETPEILVINETIAPNQEEEVLEKTGLIIAAFPQANFDFIVRRLSNANDIDAEYGTIMNEYADLPGSSNSTLRGPRQQKFSASAQKEAKKLLSTTEEKSLLSHVCKIFPDTEPSQLALLIADSTQKDLDHIIESVIKQSLDVHDDANDVKIVSEIQAELNSATPFLKSDIDWQNFSQLCNIFPDADQIFIAESIANSQQKNIMELMEELTHNGYRTRRERVKAENRERRRRRYLGVGGAQFKAEDFLKHYPNPEALFAIWEGRRKTENYKQHTKVFLLNTFRDLHENLIASIMEDYRNHLYPAYQFINNADLAFDGKKATFPALPKRRVEDLAYPEQFNEDFFREAQYCLNYEAVAAKRREKLDDARKRGTLLECPICANDECMPDEMLACNGFVTRHDFCRDCVTNHAEVQIEEGAHFVRCMDNSCDAGQFTLAALQKVLDEHMLRQLAKREQQIVLLDAKLDNLYSCPFCDFAIIIEHVDEPIFRCLDPDCMRESCLQCKEPNHLPLKCTEVERDIETQRRIFIENRMAEALKRHCPSCKKPIVKLDGCNKMTCPCGTAFCYVCGINLATLSYSHFGR
uniref:RING-type domain-containing protein n=1 Tax=Plectus sambesii TaxID=2011161 RepID=A0A914XH31_9BILA